MAKKLLFILLFIVAPAATILAQDKIAFINYQEIIMKMPETKDMQTKLEAKSAEVKKTIADMEAAYQKLLETFQSDPTEPTETVLEDRRKQLQDIETRYQTYAQQSQAELQKEQEILLTPIQEKLRKAIKDVGDQNNYLFIIDISSFLYKNANAVDANKLVETKLGI